MRKSRRTGPLHLASIALSHDGDLPMHRQLYFALREAILQRRLSPGARLPSSRSLAGDLKVSRNTVLAAFEQLLAEGYIEGRIGAGSFVSELLPEDALLARSNTANSRPRQDAAVSMAGHGPAPSKRGTFLAGLSGHGTRPRAFSPGLPELAQFPFETWAKLLQRHWRAPPESFLIGSDAQGFKGLREALAAHLGAARAVRCDASQVFIVSGAQQALDLTARVLLDPGDRVWVEDPGYPGLIGALAASGAETVAITVDREGISVERGMEIAPQARMACVSPSHQFPLGVTMSLARRLALLDWARDADAFVLEDDYDSEYRYAGHPLAALQGLDADGRVIYVGTMSKVMFPGLRLGYMVVPTHLVPAFSAVRRLTDTHPSTLAQPAMAEFISDGSLSAHIRRMRALYAQRQELLVKAARNSGGPISVDRAEAGMHLVARIGEGVSDIELSARAQAAGIEAPALSAFYRASQERNGLLLGYAGIPEKQITRCFAVLDRLASELVERQ